MERHRAALAGMAGHRNELAAYDAMVGLARRLSLDPAVPSPRRSGRRRAGRARARVAVAAAVGEEQVA